MSASEQLDAGLEPSRDADATADPEAVRDLERRLDGLRSAPGFPAGSDAAILAISRPRAYTACPNPYGLDVVADSDLPRRDVLPFATDISTGKGHPIYKAHSYPTKVPHEAIMRFLLHYTEPGDLVLDGFCGSGMAGVAAQACGRPEPEMKAAIESDLPGVTWGARRAFLQDLAPNATFLAAGLNLPVDAVAFDRASAALLKRFDREWGWMYETNTPKGQRATIDYTVWSEVFACPHCSSEVVFYEAAFVEDTGKVSDEFPCPACGARVDKGSLLRRKVPITTLAGDTIERIDLRPVRIAFRLGATAGMKRLDGADFDTLRRIGTVRAAWFPADDLPLGDMVHGSRLGPKGFARVHHLWGDRPLASLAALWSMAKEESDASIRGALLFWIEQAFWGLSWMNRYRPDGFSQVSQFQSGVYYIPSLAAECSVRYNLEGSSPARGKRAALVKHWANSPATDGLVRISTGSSEQIPLPDNSVDYVFVDPPFGANIPYSDLALVIENWHGVKTDMGSEATVDTFKHRGLPEYTSLMTACFREFYRVLRPGRWMTVEFSNSDNSIWLGIQQSLSAVGFVVVDARVFDKEQHSYRQVTAANAVRQDLIISAYKPAADVESRVRLAAGSEDGVWAFVREHLRRIEVTGADIRERHLDRIFNRVIDFHLASGISLPMSLAEFSAGIDGRFNLADGMYFLPSQEEAYRRSRLTSPADVQEATFITNEATAVAWLRRLLAGGRRTFSEIMPPFFKEMQTSIASYEELPELRDLLAENFLQDDGSRWYVPDPKDAVQMDRLHQQTLQRVFATYAEGKGMLGSVRTEAVRAGFAKAWADRDFGLISAVGRRLPEDFFITETGLHHYYRSAERLAGRT